jgi:TetR/AcrR family transcriptional regulator, mexJK operon transcriptional repressor
MRIEEHEETAPGGTAGDDRPRRPGRPKSQAKRARIAECGRELFLRNGYSGTTLADVAAAAGVARQTVYSHFPEKEALFEAAVADARARVARHAAELTGSALQARSGASPRDCLEGLARYYIQILTDPEVAALRRLAITESVRTPGLQAAWQASGPAGTRDAIAAYLSRCPGLRIDDAGLAADHFLALVGHRPVIDTLFGTKDSVSEPRRLASAVDLFIRAYQAPAPREPRRDGRNGRV